ncbi:MAG: hypothetical protein ABIL88_05370 [candidate division WOR-3 bacterium]
MKRILVILAFVLPIVVFADKGHKKGKPVKEIEGVISGAVCGVYGIACNHRPGERGYELLGLFNDKRGFFYLANVPQDILAKINREEVLVVGEVYRERATIIAEKIIKDGNVVWQAGVKEDKAKEGEEKDKGSKSK